MPLGPAFHGKAARTGQGQLDRKKDAAISRVLSSIGLRRVVQATPAATAWKLAARLVSVQGRS